MTKKRSPKRDPNTRTFVFVPERKLSETIVEFAAPMLEPLGPDAELEEMRRAIEFAINVWNFHVMATALWGKPKHLADARKAMCGPASPPGVAALFEVLAERRKSLFNGDYRFVGNWRLTPDGSGGHTLFCDAMLPKGMEPHVPPPVESRISIGGRFLDEVLIGAGANSRLGFPPERHRAEDVASVVEIRTPASAAVQMFAEGLLPSIGARAVEIVVAGRSRGPMLLAEVRAASQHGIHDIIVLVFKPAVAPVS